MDNLTDAIQPWQSTDYQWLKIQSARDPHYWIEIRSPVAAPIGSLFSLASKSSLY